MELGREGLGCLPSWDADLGLGDLVGGVACEPRTVSQGLACFSSNCLSVLCPQRRESGLRVFCDPRGTLRCECKAVGRSRTTGVRVSVCPRVRVSARKHDRRPSQQTRSRAGPPESRFPLAVLECREAGAVTTRTERASVTLMGACGSQRSWAAGLGRRRPLAPGHSWILPLCLLQLRAHTFEPCCVLCPCPGLS